MYDRPHPFLFISVVYKIKIVLITFAGGSTVHIWATAEGAKYYASVSVVTSHGKSCNIFMYTTQLHVYVVMLN